MKNSSSFLLAAALLLAVACSNDPCEVTIPEIQQPQSIRISPTIQSRVTETHFDAGDAIGLTVRRQSGETYLDNVRLLYDGTCFEAEKVLWYAESDEASTLVAVYPYLSNTLPRTFSVRADQSGAGYDASNLIAACNAAVKPSKESVRMQFRHLLTRIEIEVQAAGDAVIEQLTLQGFRPTVEVDWEKLSIGTLSGDPVETTAHAVKANQLYEVIVPPQMAEMEVHVTIGGKTVVRKLTQTELLAGKYYSLKLDLSKPDEQQVVLAGDIYGWEQGGTLELVPEKGDSDSSSDPSDPKGPESPDPEEPSEEQPKQPENSGSVVVGGVQYPTQTVNGLVWMSENLRYVPDGAVSGKDYFYPGNDSGKAETLGLLYTYETAEKGLCPEGWRLPTRDELTTLKEQVESSFYVKSGRISFDEYGSGYSYSDATSCLPSSTVSGSDVQYLVISFSISGTVTGTEVKPLAKTKFATSVRCVKAQ